MQSSDPDSRTWDPSPGGRPGPLLALIPRGRRAGKSRHLSVAERQTADAGQLDREIQGIDSKAAVALYNYSWPGNVRELRNCIESAVVMSRGDVITLEDLPPFVQDSSEDNYIRLAAGVSLADAEKEIINFTLGQNKGNKSRTAEILGIGRKTLHRKIQEYEIDG